MPASCFLFYTLAGSLPLLVALIHIQNTIGSLNFLILQYWAQPIPNKSNASIWLACIIAFIVKIPLYGLHLWLPKARRGPNCRLWFLQLNHAKTRRTHGIIRLHYSKSITRLHSISIYHVIFMRHDHNQLNLPSSNRPEVTHRILFCQPYSTCYRHHHLIQTPWSYIGATPW